MRTLFRIAAFLFSTFLQIQAAEALFPVCKEGQWGLIEKTGQLCITPRFDEIWRPFSAWIPVGPSDHEIRIVAQDLILARKGALWGYADTKGQWSIPAKFTHATHFNEGLAGVMVDGHWAFIDPTGKVVLSFEKSKGGYLFSDGLAPLAFESEGVTVWGFVDREGKEAIAARFNEVRSFHEGLAPARQGVAWGYLDRSGKWAIEPQYEDGDYFFDGRARVIKKEKAGFIDRAGRWVVNAEYAQAQRFSEGLAAVSDGKTCGFVDAQGAVVIPLKLHDVRSFREGLAAAALGQRYGYIDKAGAWVIKAQFESAEDFSEGLAAVSKDDRFGYVDRAGRMVIAFQFDEARPFKDGLAEVRIDEKWGYIDAQGKYVWAPSD